MCCDSWGRKESDTTERLIRSDLISFPLPSYPLGRPEEWRLDGSHSRPGHLAAVSTAYVGLRDESDDQSSVCVLGGHL